MNAAKDWPSILRFDQGATVTEEIVGKHYRELAKKYHPDAGGSIDDMQQLNLAKQLALNWIKGERQRQQELKRAEEIAAQHFAAAQSSLRAAYAQQAAAQQSFANQMNSAFWAQGASQAHIYQPMPSSPPPVALELRKSWLRRMFIRKVQAT